MPFILLVLPFGPVPSRAFFFVFGCWELVHSCLLLLLLSLHSKPFRSLYPDSDDFFVGVSFAESCGGWSASLGIIPALYPIMSTLVFVLFQWGGRSGAPPTYVAPTFLFLPSEKAFVFRSLLPRARFVFRRPSLASRQSPPYLYSRLAFSRAL